MRYLYISLLLFVSFIKTYNADATHLRAGDITAKVISLETRTYEFILTLYRDTDGVDQENATLNFGDGSPCQNVKLSEGNRVKVGDKTERLTFYFRHSYASDGDFLISFNEENRNDQINNINNGQSIVISFYVKTILSIDAFNGVNNTPVLLIPPIDEAARGQVFLHNPGAYDPDGDSLAYVMDVPRAYTNGEHCNTGEAFVVPGYKSPADPVFGGLNENRGPATFTLDPITGDLVWNTPGRIGEYNVAFVVEEWRKVNGQWIKLGAVTRDMQINVKDTDNKRPILTIPKDTCVVAGTLLKGTITAEDPDKDRIFMSSYSGVYPPYMKNSPAFYSGSMNVNPVHPDSAKPSRVTKFFTWQTNCEHVRLKPYQVIFKAEDFPKVDPSLVDFKTWNVTVVGPKPGILAATPQTGKSIELMWEPYTCTNASKILIYRKEGPYPYTPANCELGIPQGSGYVLVGQTSVNNTGFVDKAGLKRGVQYCYRLVAQFPGPGGGLSYVSDEVCAELKLDAPIVTNVTVDKTDEQKGQITVKWTRPLELDKVNFPGPYEYRIYRSSGLNPQEAPTLLKSIPTDLTGSKNDTTLVDSLLNTTRNAYNYQILFFYKSSFLLDSSEVASSVRLSAGGGINSIRLSWEYNTPWINTDFYIFRQNKQSGKFELIDSTQTPTYTDAGKGGVPMNPETEYCYYVLSKGTYNNPKIVSPLFNYSQITCQSARDTIAPCPPVLSIREIDCKNFEASPSCNPKDYFNTLWWTDVQDPNCENDDIAYYKLYYAFSKDTTLFELIAPQVVDTFFLHKDNPYFYAGCYAVTAVDRSGNESKYSNVVCNDNCPFLLFPNIITPNGDDKNQTFKPFNEKDNCPRFLEMIDLKIVNRWGKVVFDSEKAGTNEISWDGRTTDGTELATGVYFYEATVKFIALDPKKANQVYKGWVQLLK